MPADWLAQSFLSSHLGIPSSSCTVLCMATARIFCGDFRCSLPLLAVHLNHSRSQQLRSLPVPPDETVFSVRHFVGTRSDRTTFSSPRRFSSGLVWSGLVSSDTSCQAVAFRTTTVQRAHPSLLLRARVGYRSPGRAGGCTGSRSDPRCQQPALYSLFCMYTYPPKTAKSRAKIPLYYTR
jgi:hypothetical protein